MSGASTAFIPTTWIAGIDVMDLAGDAARQVRQE
jgi:hypothetical protein